MKLCNMLWWHLVINDLLKHFKKAISIYDKKGSSKENFFNHFFSSLDTHADTSFASHVISFYFVDEWWNKRERKEYLWDWMSLKSIFLLFTWKLGIFLLWKIYEANHDEKKVIFSLFTWDLKFCLCVEDIKHLKMILLRYY